MKDNSLPPAPCANPSTPDEAALPGRVRIAVPLVDGPFAAQFAAHFGSAKAFALFVGDSASGSLQEEPCVKAPEHRPGVLPAWLASLKADRVVVSAIGERALILLADAGIEAFQGDETGEPRHLAQLCLAGKLPRARLENSRCHGDHDHACAH
jgi:predicted Fe-Mo cluster-binding NifX family protein